MYIPHPVLTPERVSHVPLSHREHDGGVPCVSVRIFPVNDQSVHNQHTERSCSEIGDRNYWGGKKTSRTSGKPRPFTFSRGLHTFRGLSRTGL
jgi:hypothetical protein